MAAPKGSCETLRQERYYLQASLLSPGLQHEEEGFA